MAKVDSSFLKNWLTGLPTVPSHYCPNVPSYKEKKFLEPGTTKTHLFREYQKAAGQAGARAVGMTFFSKIFDEEKYSVFSPRKDQCDICMGAKHGNVDQQIFNAHIQSKNEVRAEKMKDKKAANDTVSVWTMDVQAVFTCPKTKASTMYYKTKLQVHNYTCFNLGTKEGYCYPWEEHEGDLSAEVFAYLQYQHFVKILKAQPTIKKIIVWSDGCTYQNRNTPLSNVYLHLAKEYDIVIEQKFLVVGHTQMECDSMHSTVERKIVADIFTPCDYYLIMEIARIRPSPYHVIPFHHHDFMTLTGSYVNSIRPGKKTGDPTVYKLRALQYTTSGNIRYKLDFASTTDWKDIPQRINMPTTLFKWKRLFNFQQPISLRKFNDLQSMKLVLPKEAHHYYDTLPHCNA